MNWRTIKKIRKCGLIMNTHCFILVDFFSFDFPNEKSQVAYKNMNFNLHLFLALLEITCIHNKWNRKLGNLRGSVKGLNYVHISMHFFVLCCFYFEVQSSNTFFNQMHNLNDHLASANYTRYFHISKNWWLGKGAPEIHFNFSSLRKEVTKILISENIYWFVIFRIVQITISYVVCDFYVVVIAIVIGFLLAENFGDLMRWKNLIPMNFFNSGNFKIDVRGVCDSFHF